MDNAVAKLFKSPKTVFTNKDLSLIWQENNSVHLKSKISYYVKQGYLNKLTRRIYSKDKNYDLKELAASVYSPSYVSFETILREAGVIFQHYDTVFVAGQWSRTIEIDNHTFTFRKLKDSVLYNSSGILNRGNYSIATVERAFLDTIYLLPGYYFDNLRPIDWKKCFELVKIYGNKQMIKRLKKYAE